MDFNCRLEIQDDTKAFYVGPSYDENGYYRGDQKVEARVGSDELMLRTVELLKDWVEYHDEHCTRPELEILGLYLYKIAFGTPENVASEETDSGTAVQPCPLKEAFESTYKQFVKQLSEQEKRGEPESRLRLMLVLHKKAKRLSMFPWEFICMPSGDGGSEEEGSFLAGENTDLILARFVPDTNPPRDVQPDSESKALRILIALSEPEKLPIVEANILIDELLGLKSKQIIVEPFYLPTRRTLSKKIAEFKPHIMHFIGHGRKDGLALHREEQELEELRAEDKSLADLGEPPLPVEAFADWLDGKSVRDLFSDYRPPLVFLHACEGGAPYLLRRSLTSFSSTARELAYTTIPAVIAMQYKISNDDAQRFAQKFYRQIRKGKHIDEAVMVARRELGRFSPSKSGQAWGDRRFGTPVIYLQSEKPIIQAPLSETEGSVPGGTPLEAMEKVSCPYPDCTGKVIPGKRLCLKCTQPLLRCPKCESVVAELYGICDTCLWRVEASAQPAPGAAPRPAVDPSSVAPEPRLVVNVTPADPTEPAQPAGGYDIVSNGHQAGNE